MKKFLLQSIIIIIIGLSFVNCGGGSGSETDDAAFNTKEKEFLYGLFTDEYLWNDKADTGVDYLHFQAPSEMIDALRYKELDRWSHAFSKEEYYDYVNQKTSGFGFHYYTDSFLVIYPIINSPAYKAGLQRGDQIIKVNGSTNVDEELYYAHIRLGVKSTFTVLRDGNEISIEITPAEYTYKTTNTKIIDDGSGTKTGYMIYNQFSANSDEEIENAFTYFKDENINELVIDLRYNPGGDTSIASLLLDKIAGGFEEHIQYCFQSNGYYMINEAKDKSYECYRFEKDDNTLSLDRVFFITTGNSASASELVINALKPYMDVILIGSQTYGKPVGSRGRYLGEKANYIYFIINLSLQNADGEGNYFDGIPVDCQADDDIYHQRGDTEEDMLNEALYYIENGQCKD